jgi:hypothetical protein
MASARCSCFWGFTLMPPLLPGLWLARREMKAEA